VRRLFARLNRENTTELREYESFDAALRDSDSYEDPRLVEVVKEKTKRYRESLDSRAPIRTRQMIQNLFVLSYVEPPEASVTGSTDRPTSCAITLVWQSS